MQKKNIINLHFLIAVKPNNKSTKKPKISARYLQSIFVTLLYGALHISRLLN